MFLPCGESVVVPVPEKQVRGVCDVNTFRGISLTSLVSKGVCKILDNRLSRERPYSGRPRWLLEEERVQGPNTVSGVIGTNRDGEEACGYIGSIHKFCKRVYMIKWTERSCGLVCRVWV